MAVVAASYEVWVLEVLLVMGASFNSKTVRICKMLINIGGGNKADLKFEDHSICGRQAKFTIYIPSRSCNIEN